MQTYDALAEMQKSDPRLRIHAICTATDINMDEIRRLTTYLFERCPKMDHHNLAIIRGDRKNPSLQGPTLEEYEKLYHYVRRLWSEREEGRYGSVVEPMLQWAKTRTAETQSQVVPCKAGVLTGVIYSNGDVSVCETHAPLGNLRRKDVLGNLGLTRGSGNSAVRSLARNATAPTRCFSGRASSINRRNWPGRWWPPRFGRKPNRCPRASGCK